MLGTCFGAVLIRDAGFLNSVTIFFYAIALVPVIPAVLKYLDRRLRGLIPLPNHAVLFQLDHVTEHTTRERPIKGVRETTIRFRTQPVVFTRLAAENQEVPVICSACQTRAVFRVDSLKTRRQKILRKALIYGTMVLASITLAVVFISDPAKADALPGVVGSVIGFGFLIFFFWGMVGVGLLLNYNGVQPVNLPFRHHLRHPDRKELESFHKQASEAK
jgi:small-conductance mechanosensitive channel